MSDPYFGVIIPFDVTKANKFSKANNVSFFGRYLHDCMRAINAEQNFKYRIKEDEVVEFDTIHASATIMRKNKTFGFSFIDFDENLSRFLDNLEAEKQRIFDSRELYPPKNSLDCIHCSALPWVNFTGHKEPVSGKLDSVPKLAFGKAVNINGSLIMQVAINVNHALVDGYHLSQFAERFQEFLNE